MKYGYIPDTVNHIFNILHIENNDIEINNKLQRIIAYAILTGGHDTAVFKEAWDIAYKQS